MGTVRPRVLIADDEADTREALAALLSDCDLALAADGNEALRLAAGFSPELMLLDINMPGLSGLQVLERTASLKPRPLAIMITAETDLEAGMKAVALGSYAYLSKPLEADRVKETVAGALAEYRRRNR